jgi:hypothetical protein
LKSELERLLADAINTLVGSVLPQAVDPAWISVERARDASHGDYACNIALRLAKSAGRPPREIAQAIVAALAPSPMLARAEVAGAGFINLHLLRGAHSAELRRILERGAHYGESDAGRRRARDTRIRLGQPDRTAARGPRPPGGLRRQSRQSAARHRPRACSASTTSTMPAGRWTSSRSVPGCAICRPVAPSCRFHPTAIAATTCMPSPRSSSCAAAASCSGRPP